MIAASKKKKTGKDIVLKMTKNTSVVPQAGNASATSSKSSGILQKVPIPDQFHAIKKEIPLISSRSFAAVVTIIIGVLSLLVFG